MKKLDQVDCTVLGTVGSCILKSIAFDFNNTPIQRSTTDRHCFKRLTLCSYQNTRSKKRFYFFEERNYITDHPVYGRVGPRFRLALFYEKNYTNDIVILVHYVKTPFS